MRTVWTWLTNWERLWKKLYFLGALSAVAGVWRPWHVSGGLPGDAWIWTAAVCFTFGTLVRAEERTLAIGAYMLGAGIGLLSTGAGFVIGTVSLTAPQASVLIAIAGGITILILVGAYGLNRSHRH